MCNESNIRAYSHELLGCPAFRKSRLVMCCGVLGCWIKIHTRYFKPLWPKHRASRHPQYNNSRSFTQRGLMHDRNALGLLVSTATSFSSSGTADHGGSSYHREEEGAGGWVGRFTRAVCDLVTGRTCKVSDDVLDRSISNNSGSGGGGEVHHPDHAGASAVESQQLLDPDGEPSSSSAPLLSMEAPSSEWSSSSLSSSSAGCGSREGVCSSGGNGDRGSSSSVIRHDADVPPPCDMSEPSEIMNGRMVAALVFAMPSPLLKERAWNCVYSLVRDGACCATLMKSCRHHATYLLVVRLFHPFLFYGTSSSQCWPINI